MSSVLYLDVLGGETLGKIERVTNLLVRQCLENDLINKKNLLNLNLVKNEEGLIR